MQESYALLWDIFHITFTFFIGASVGSFLNVCIYRLPQEKSLWWPGSRCFSCLKPIHGWANIPILSYFLLRGKCRTCQASYSARYMFVELFTGISFALLFWYEILSNGHKHFYLRDAHGDIFYGQLPINAWLHWLCHALFLCFLIIAALCDLDGRIIPLSVTIPGTLVGLLIATLFPWPWPEELIYVQDIQRTESWAESGAIGKIPRGLYPWPVWGPLPDWLAPRSTLLGLFTGLAGAVTGNLMLRIIKILFEKGLRREALGLGDADLVMMAGAFLGWQQVIVAFFIGNFVALAIMLPVLILTGNRYSPFGPGLAIGMVITWMTWRFIGPSLQWILFDPFLLLFCVGFFAIGIPVMALMLRLLPEPPDRAEGSHSA